MNYLIATNYRPLLIQDGRIVSILVCLCTNRLTIHLPNYLNLRGLEDHLMVKKKRKKAIENHYNTKCLIILFYFVLGGDQGLLNMFFKDWAHKDIAKHLSFTYNVVWSSTYSYLPALKQ